MQRLPSSNRHRLRLYRVNAFLRTNVVPGIVAVLKNVTFLWRVVSFGVMDFRWLQSDVRGSNTIALLLIIQKRFGSDAIHFVFTSDSFETKKISFSIYFIRVLLLLFSLCLFLCAVVFLFIENNLTAGTGPGRGSMRPPYLRNPRECKRQSRDRPCENNE